MRYLLAILLPPLAMLSCGKLIQAILCVLLMITILGWPLASIWALFVVNAKVADERQARLIAALEAQAGKAKKRGFRWF